MQRVHGEAPQRQILKFPGAGTERIPYDKSHLVHLRLRGEVYWVDYFYQGRRVRKSLDTSNRKVAECCRAELEAKVRAGTHREPIDIRLEDLVEGYLKHASIRLSHKDLKTREGYLRAFARMVAGIKVSQILPVTVEDFLGAIKDGKVAAKTYNNARGYLHALFEHAKRHDNVVQNVIERVERRPEVWKTIRFLKTQGEISDLIALFVRGPLENAVPTYFYAGLRRTELCWLTRDDTPSGHDLSFSWMAG